MLVVIQEDNRITTFNDDDTLSASRFIGESIGKAILPHGVNMLAMFRDGVFVEPTNGDLNDFADLIDPLNLNLHFMI